ncbi:MAG: hypothetical protein M3Q63_03705 [bacterium]|nr:hypothetical protein [bacterium]
MNHDYVLLGVLRDKKNTGILAYQKVGTRSKIYWLWSEDGLRFKPPTREVTIFRDHSTKEAIHNCSHFQFLKTIDGYVVSYIRQEEGRRYLVVALSHDMYSWKVQSTMPTLARGAALLPLIQKKSTFIMYVGDTFFYLMKSPDFIKWVREPGLLMTSRGNFFDSMPLSIIAGFNTKKGFLILYDASYTQGHNYTLQVGAVLFSKTDPKKIIWRSEDPLWTSLVASKEPLYPLGATLIEKDLHVYWASHDGGIITAAISSPFVEELIEVTQDQHYLKKHKHNPILEPHDHNDWEAEAVFNPAALYDEGKVHLLYRAIGRNGISVLGYARSEDGFNFDRHHSPIFEPTEGCGMPTKDEDVEEKIYNPLVYTSGGGWSGCEDPRAVKIGRRIYVTYLAFGGWNSMRLALTSIKESDFHNGRWVWTEPQFISPPGEVHKNWVLFPEKINGKFAFLHSISPTIQVHYADSLKDFNGELFIKSTAPSGGRKNFWDSKVRGAGPPPLKTKLGWLLLYHANDLREPHKYKLGAMILDKNDPSKVLYRTTHPILSPNMDYENNGKPGIVYASGAIIKDDQLFVYYGGADRVVCVASTPVDELLEKIANNVGVQLKPQHSLAV